MIELRKEKLSDLGDSILNKVFCLKTPNKTIYDVFVKYHETSVSGGFILENSRKWISTIMNHSSYKLYIPASYAEEREFKRQYKRRQNKKNTEYDRIVLF